MMEQVRVQTEGKDVKPLVGTVAKKTVKASDEYFPGEHDLDKELFAKADEVQKEVANMKDPTIEEKPKKPAALATQSQETQAQRAALLRHARDEEGRPHAWRRALRDGRRQG